jgi:hypothetical protein
LNARYIAREPTDGGIQVQNDHWEIVAVQNRYGQACDRRDRARFADVFTLGTGDVLGPGT